MLTAVMTPELAVVFVADAARLLAAENARSNRRVRREKGGSTSHCNGPVGTLLVVTTVIISSFLYASADDAEALKLV